MFNKLKKELKYKIFLISISLLPLNVYATIPTFNTSDILTEIEGLIMDNMSGAMDDWVATTATSGADAVSDSLKNCMDMDALFGPLAELGGGEIPLPCGASFGFSNPLDDLAQGLAGDLSGLAQSMVDELIDDLVSGKLLKDMFCKMKKDAESDGPKINPDVIKGGCEGILKYWEEDKTAKSVLNYLKTDKLVDADGIAMGNYISEISITNYDGSQEKLKGLTNNFKNLIKLKKTSELKSITGEGSKKLAENAVEWQFYLYQQCISKGIASFMGCVNLNYTDGSGQKIFLSNTNEQSSVDVEILSPPSMSCLIHDGLFMQNFIMNLSNFAAGLNTSGCGTEDTDDLVEKYLDVCYTANELFYTIDGKFSDKNKDYEIGIGECFYSSIAMNTVLPVLSDKEIEYLTVILDNVNKESLPNLNNAIKVVDENIEEIEKKSKGSTDKKVKKTPPKKKKKKNIDTDLKNSIDTSNSNNIRLAGHGVTSDKISTQSFERRKQEAYIKVNNSLKENSDINEFSTIQDIQKFDYIGFLKNYKDKSGNDFEYIRNKVVMKTRIPIPFAYGVEKGESGENSSYEDDSRLQDYSMNLIWASPLDVVDSFYDGDESYYSNHYLHKSNLAQTTSLPENCSGGCTFNELAKDANNLQSVMTGPSPSPFYDFFTTTMVSGATVAFSEGTGDIASSEGIVMNNFNYTGAAELLYKNTMEIMKQIKSGGGSNSERLKAEFQWKSSFMAQILTLDVLNKILENQVNSNYINNSSQIDTTVDLLTNDSLIEIMRKLDDINNNLSKLK